MTRGLLALMLLALPCCAATVETPTSLPAPVLTADDELQILRELPALPKVHYCWGVYGYASGTTPALTDPRWAEYVRICNGLGLVATIQPRYVAQAVELCARVNRERPRIQATLAYNYSLWHYVFPADAPPTDADPGEIDLFRKRMESLRDVVAETNTSLGSDVRVAAILIDSERFNHRKSGEGVVEWNAAISEKLNAGYEAAKTVFPQATVDWCYRGIVWKRMDPNLVKGDSYSTSLYCPSSPERDAWEYRDLFVKASADGVGRIVVWIAGGTTGTLTPLEGNPQYVRFAFDADYDSGLSWANGRNLNRLTYAGSGEHWEDVSAVVWYPQPWRTPYWFKHFVAYCRGATWNEREMR